MDSNQWPHLLTMMMYTLTLYRDDPMDQLDVCIESTEQEHVPLGTYLDAIRSALATDEPIGPVIGLSRYPDATLREFLRAAERKIAAKLGQ